MSAARLSDEQIAAANRYPLQRLVEQDIGRLRRDGFALCPFRSEKTPSFHVFRSKEGFWFFKCFGCGVSGTPVKWMQLMRHLSFVDAVLELTSGPAAHRSNGETSSRRFLPELGATGCFRLGRPTLVMRDSAQPRGSIAPGSRSATSGRDPLLYVTDLWSGADAPRLAELYLYSRGIALRALPEALRGHNRVWCAETRQERPCVLAALTEHDGAVLAVQRIWVERSVVCDENYRLPAKGSRAADLKAGKKTIGDMRRGAVRLSPAGSVLGIAEGVESAMSAAQLFSLPVWATCGASRFASIEIPEVVEEIIIFGDDGKAGNEAAQRALQAYSARGYRVSTEFPPPGCDDWNAFLVEWQ